MRDRSSVPFAASVLVYVAVTAIVGRDVLAQLATAVAGDAGDPLFTSALLYWNATHIPLSDAWWQLPIFHPTRDTLAFSEHLLGLSLLTTPLYWLTGSVISTYNIATLLTFPLCAAAMYLLVRRLTGSAAGAFVAGLVFGFAPYRVAHLSHIQMLAAFWSPIALLGLHGYLESGRRRWLVVYACAWLLQAATNTYLLVLLSVLVGLWTLWFVVARRAWSALGPIAAASAVAVLPLVPILYTYVSVHARNGFVRTLDEMREYGADVAAVLCAPEPLTFWGWLRIQCRPEGDLFPGLAVVAIGIVALTRLLVVDPVVDPTAHSDPPGGARRQRGRRSLLLLRRLLLAVAAIYAALTVGVLLAGPIRLELGAVRLSSSSIVKPFLIGLGALIGALFLSNGVRTAARRSSTLGFYLVAAVLTWMLALGPTVAFMGRRVSLAGPFAWLAMLPGGDGLRVPARFWLMTVLCMAVAAGIAMADLLRGRARWIRTSVLVTTTAVVLMDGWTRIPTAPLPSAVEHQEVLEGLVVLELPPDNGPRDIAAEHRAILGGWKTVNGYSGYIPGYYAGLRDGIRLGDDAAFRPLRAMSDLRVIVPRDAAPALRALVERQPGAVLVAEGPGGVQFRLPREAFSHSRRPEGTRLPIAAVRSSCAPDSLAMLTDNDPRNRWRCEQKDESVLVDLGRVTPVGALVYYLGPWYWEFATEIDIDTSADGVTWLDARTGSVIAEVIQGGLDDPRSLAAVLPFAPRPARYVRLHPTGREEAPGWTASELEVWSGSGR